MLRRVTECLDNLVMGFSVTIRRSGEDLVLLFIQHYYCLEVFGPLLPGVWCALQGGSVINLLSFWIEGWLLGSRLHP